MISTNHSKKLLKMKVVTHLEQRTLVDQWTRKPNVNLSKLLISVSSQTFVVSVLDACVNTDKELFETVNDMVGVNSNGEIHPKDGEVLIEMAVSHDFKSWDEIKIHVRSNEKMKILGVPWLANSGRQFKTVVFRTWLQDFETWKGDTFDWQASGIRGVTTSRVVK